MGEKNILNNVVNNNNLPAIKISTNNFNRANYNKPQKNFLVFVLIFFIIFLITTTILYCYGIFIKSGTTLTNKIINLVSNNIDESLNYFEVFDNNNTLKIDGDVNFETNIEKYKEINNYKLKYNYINDLKNNESSFNATMNINNNMIDILTNLKKDGLYINSSELYDKTIFSDINYNIKETNISIDDLKYANNKIKKILLNTFTDEMFDISFENATIDDEQVYSRKILFNLDKETYIKINDYITSEIIKDNKLSEILVNIIKNNNKEYNLNNLKNDLLKYKNIKAEDMTNTKIIIYTNILGNKILKLDITDDNYNASYQSYKYKSYININDVLLIDCINNKNLKKVNITYDKKDIATLEIKKFKVNNIDLNYVIIDNENINKNLLEGSLLLEKNKNNIKFDLKAIKDKASLETIINYENKANSIKLNYKNNNDFINLNITNNLSTADSIKLLDTSNLIKLENMTDKDINKIKNNLKKKIDNTLFEIINSYI